MLWASSQDLPPGSGRCCRRERDSWSLRAATRSRRTQPSGCHGIPERYGCVLPARCPCCLWSVASGAAGAHARECREDANQQTTECDSPPTLKKSRIPDEHEDLSRTHGMWKDEIVSREAGKRDPSDARQDPELIAGKERSLNGLSRKAGSVQDDVEKRAQRNTAAGSGRNQMVFCPRRSNCHTAQLSSAPFGSSCRGCSGWTNSQHIAATTANNAARLNELVQPARLAIHGVRDAVTAPPI